MFFFFSWCFYIDHWVDYCFRNFRIPVKSHHEILLLNILRFCGNNWDPSDAQLFQHTHTKNYVFKRIVALLGTLVLFNVVITIYLASHIIIKIIIFRTLLILIHGKLLLTPYLLTTMHVVLLGIEPRTTCSLLPWCANRCTMVPLRKKKQFEY